MRQITLTMLLLALTTSCSRQRKTSAEFDMAQTRQADQCLGQWNGPEGTYLIVEGGPSRGGKYSIEIHSLDGTNTYEVVSEGNNHVEFLRDGKRESIHAGDGQDTGMKWLLDKKNCLIIKSGEGFCRN